MRRYWLGIVLLTFTGAVWAQPVPGPLVCSTSVTVAPIVRTEGITELVGDILLQCTGGTPTALGQTIPGVNIAVQLNTAVTSRMLSNPYSEALLLIDEPGSAANPVPQVVCGAPRTTLIAPAVCSVLGTGNGRATFDGSTNRPNVYQGLVSGNQVTFNGVPIDPPGTTSTRIFRMTNVRANANALGLSSTLVPTQIVGSISASPAGVLQINNPNQTVASIQQGLVPGPSAALTAQTCQDLNKNFLSGQGTNASPHFDLIVKEGFPTSFRRRSSASGILNPLAIGAQNIPGAIYNSETGLYFPGFPTIPGQGNLGGAGLADYGTIVDVQLHNVPDAVDIFTTPTFTIFNASGGVTGAASVLTSGTPGSFIKLAKTAPGTVEAFVLIAAVDPKVINDFAMSFYPAFVANTVNPTTVTGNASLLPFANTTFGLYVPTASNPDIIPRFAPPGNGIVAQEFHDLALFSMVPCGNQSPALQTFFPGAFTPPAQFNTYSGPLTPSSMNVGIVSPGPAVSNLSVSKDAGATWLAATLDHTTTPANLTLTVTPQPAGTYNATVTVTSPQTPGSPASLPVRYTSAPGAWFVNYEFKSAASYVSNAVAPGENFVIIGHEFGPPTLAPAGLGSDGRVLTQLGETRVLFDGQPSALYYSTNGVVSGFAPFSLAGKTSTKVQVEYQGKKSPEVVIPVLDAVPALYTSNSSGGGQGVISNQDGSVNGPGNPESPGNYVVLWGTGGGDQDPPGRDGAFNGVGAPLGKLKLATKVFIDGVEATDVSYAGPAPTIVEGVWVVVVRIPANARRNANLPVLVQMGDKTTQALVTVAVK